MAYATTLDVATELARDEPTGAIKQQWDKWLARAERQIRQRVPVLDEWCEEPDYMALVIDVESAAVARKVLNPEGVRSVMTQIDDANLQKTIDASRADGEIKFTEDEWALLMRLPQSDLETAIMLPDNPTVVKPVPWVWGD